MNDKPHASATASQLVGRSGEPVFALALSSGGLNTVVQLGTAHALLASGGKAPDVIAGISNGAVNAAAIAEVLQARAAGKNAAQTLRRFIWAYEGAPEELLRAWLPDPLDLGHELPNKALRLPIYPADERRERDGALQRRRGLLQLANETLGSSLKVGTLFKATERTLLAPIGEERTSFIGTFACNALMRSPVALARLGFIYAELKACGRGDLLDRMLDRYGLRDALAGEHGLRALLVRHFDPGYYGRTDLGGAVERALRGADDPIPPSVDTSRRTLGSYRVAEPAIDVVALAADLHSGYLEALPGTVPLVDALLAATSLVPLLPAVAIDEHHFDSRGKRPPQRHFVDGANVSDEPVTAVVRYLRGEPGKEPRLHPDATSVHVYPVSSIPTSERALAVEVDISRLSQVALRALDLEQARRATIERRITDLYTRMLSTERALHKLRVKRTRRGLELANADDRCSFERIFVRAQVHPIEPDRPVRLGSEVIRAGSATERRAAVLGVVADGCRATLEATIQDAIHASAGGAEVTSCASALSKRWPDRAKRTETLGEVCDACKVTDAAGTEHRQILRVLRHKDLGPSWPFDPALGKAPQLPAVDPSPRNSQRSGKPQGDAPTISLLFSGGVFRGVFQLGALAALSEAGVTPNIIAGSSVGTLTAAMAGEVLLTRRDERDRLLGDLAATYLALDKLVHTDRLFEAVGRFLRTGAGTSFTLAELRALLVSRRPLSPTARQRVLRDIQRLAFCGPAEVETLVEALHSQNYGSAAAQVGMVLDGMLRRSGVGLELLGSEPLATIIRERLLSRQSNAGANAATFARFAPLAFLATTTDIADGRLVILGDPSGKFPPESVSLLEGVLASSAFPGVFRPRWSWEVQPGAGEQRAFVDGGILDNLPLDAVAHYLDHATHIARRPRAAPHLILTTSLEPHVVRRTKTEPLVASWRERQERVKELRNNRKVEQYATVQRDLRLLHLKAPGQTPWEPVDIEVANVVPRWLVPTFGVHTALGFDREAQAASIAHGCATTMRTLARLERTQPAWARAWKLDTGVKPRSANASHAGGGCWLRPGRTCPFGSARLSKQGHPEATRRSLERVHALCPSSARRPGE